MRRILTLLTVMATCSIPITLPAQSFDPIHSANEINDLSEGGDLWDVVEHASAWMVRTRRDHGLDKRAVRRINASSVGTIMYLMSQGSGSLFVMHGAAELNEELSTIDDAKALAIALRREEAIAETPMSLASQIELGALSVILQRLAEDGGFDWTVESSGNGMAKVVAQTLGYRVGVPFTYNPTWDGYSYPEEHSNDDLAALMLGDQLPWDEGVIDTVWGAEAFFNIHQEVGQARIKASGENFMVVTYPEQIAAAAQQSGVEAEPMSPLALLWIPDAQEQTSYLLRNGIFQ